MNNKVCKWCGEDKPLAEFSLRKDKNVHRAECRKCNAERRRELYKTKNKEKILARNKKYIESRIEYKRQYDKNREKKIKEKRGAQRKDYYLANNEGIKKQTQELLLQQ